MYPYNPKAFLYQVIGVFFNAVNLGIITCDLQVFTLPQWHLIKKCFTHHNKTSLLLLLHTIPSPRYASPALLHQILTSPF